MFLRKCIEIKIEQNLDFYEILLIAQVSILV